MTWSLRTARNFFKVLIQHLKEDHAAKLFFIVTLWKFFIIFAGIYGLIVMEQSLPLPGTSFGDWDMWARWDGTYYLDISMQGYIQPQFAAFFPLYPLLIRLVSGLLQVNPIISGMLISHFALWGGLYFVFKIAELLFSKKVAYTAIFLLLFFPFSIFYGLVYTEALFLFLSAGTFYFIFKERWWLVFIFSFGAALTRNIGVFLFIPLCIEYFERYGWRFKKHLVALLGPVVGLTTYMIYLHHVLGDPLAFVHAQKNWGRSIVLNPFIIAENVWQRLTGFFQHHNIVMVVEIISGLSFLVLILLSFRKKYRFRKSLLIFSFLMLLPGLLQNTWASVNRYTIVIFPVFIMLGLLLHNKSSLKNAILGGFAIIFGVSLILFVNLRWAG